MTDEQRRQLVLDARGRMQTVVGALRQRLDPLDAQAVLMGPAIDLLARSLGGKEAANYLRSLADEVEKIDWTPPPAELN